VNVADQWGRERGRGQGLAPWWRRAVALTIDSVLLVGVTEGAFAALDGYSYLGRHHDKHQALLWLAIILVVATLYYAPVMRASDGQTLGKWLLGIRVVRTDGQAMSATRALWRQVALLLVLPGAVTQLGPFASAIVSVATIVDYLWPLWDKENRAIHDMLTGTRVRLARPALVEADAGLRTSAP
jgi:uncharacterized RDD family membrane protein YckC